MDPLITLKEVSLQREETRILSDVSFEVKQGEQWVLLGRNGSGKTSLLEMINGYLFPSTGIVEVLGHTYGQCDVREVRKQIGYISQSLMEKLTLRDPVWEVVATGEYGYLRFYEHIPEWLQAKAIQMLEFVKLGHLKNHLLSTLSQGERKKIMLARALMTNPSILIMDEPCAGLDLYEREKLLASIHDLSTKQVTVVYVTHHIEEIMPMFTHVALLEQGKLLVAGAKKEVLVSENLHKAYQVPVELDWVRDRPWIRIKESIE